jgi:hypothetical protein
MLFAPQWFFEQRLFVLNLRFYCDHYFFILLWNIVLSDGVLIRNILLKTYTAMDYLAFLRDYLRK